jgi:hypothetical protein
MIRKRIIYLMLNSTLWSFDLLHSWCLDSSLDCISKQRYLLLIYGMRVQTTKASIKKLNRKTADLRSQVTGHKEREEVCFFQGFP